MAVPCEKEGHQEEQVLRNAVGTASNNLNNSDEVEQESESDKDDDDSFVPPTPDCESTHKPLRSAGSGKYLMGTGLSIKSRETLSKLAEFFGAEILSELSPAVRVLVADTPDITLKWLYARCRRIPVVKSTWMEACLMEKQCLPADQYLWEKEFSIPDFLKSLDLILCPPFVNYSLPDLKVRYLLLIIFGFRYDTGDTAMENCSRCLQW